MNVRTVSQLNEALEISNEDLFQISKYQSSNNYMSQKITFSNILNEIKTNVDNKMNNEYSFNTKTIPDIYEKITINKNEIKLLDKNITEINSSIKNLNEHTPSWGIKDKNSNFISPNLAGKVIKNPNDSDNKFFIFNFDENKKIKYTDSQIIPKTGNLFCYGWITAPKVIDPAEAWVGIEAKNKNGDWILISLQPWIIGNNSNVMQYIGFNCPVQRDMEIRVTTGFTITDFSRSFSGRGLVLNIESEKINSNINNCFIGYILG